jgi:Outer membrane protein beta-barrel domain
MFKRIVFAACALMLASAPAFAQKAEVGVTFGWVFADGVSGNTYIVPGVGTFSRVDPKDSFGWGIDLGFFIGPNAEVGFLYSNQPTKLQVSGSTTVDVGNMSVNTYHGTYTYNFGAHDAAVRPYLMGGLGATDFGGVSYSTVNRTGTTQGATRFSTTWGAGAKFYGASKVGGRFGVRWTPAYMKSDPGGYWCDPYWGCYLVGNAKYSNQFELQGGITFRF